MPLFIDLHIDANLTPDLVNKCHVADKEIQERYGVEYKQVLLNQPQGYLFCLMEAPDKEACAKVHQLAHGNIACNVLEITQSDFSALLANKMKNSQDLTLNTDGSLDNGNRIILVVNLLGEQRLHHAARNIAVDVLQKSGGRNAESLQGQLVTLFDACTTAVNAGMAVIEAVSGSGIPIEVRAGIDIGPPLKERGVFFEDVCRSADYFSFISANRQLTISSRVSQLCTGPAKLMTSVRIVSASDQKFLNQLMAAAEQTLSSDLNVELFAESLALSKSQLGRKIKSLTDFSPNEFLKEFRMRKATALLTDHAMNITQVTMAVGFSNPSYFTKCFRKRFGKGPSDYFPSAIGLQPA